MTVLDERRVSTGAATAGTDSARRAMIDSQLRVSGVTDERVLAAMMRVRREDHVPARARTSAYIDRAIALGDGRFLAAPLVHGKMLVEAAATPADHALVVDGGSGYLPALVESLVGSYDVVAPDAAPGRRKKGSYTLLLIDGAIEQLPDALGAQLAEGGRIVTGLVTRGVTRLAVGRKVGGQVALVPLAEIGIPVLPEFAAPQGWSF